MDFRKDTRKRFTRSLGNLDGASWAVQAYLKRHFVPNNSQNGTEMAIRATSKMVIIDPFENEEFMFFFVLEPRQPLTLS